jgi:hypothetical protein
MFDTEAGIVIDVKLEQFVNAPLSINPTVFGIVTLVKLVQFENKYMLICETFGITTDVKLVQPENTELSRVFIKVGRLILVKLVHPENAADQIDLTEFGITMVVKLEQL